MTGKHLPRVWVSFSDDKHTGDTCALALTVDKYEGLPDPLDYFDEFLSLSESQALQAEAEQAAYLQGQLDALSGIDGQEQECERLQKLREQARKEGS